jgi:hypothetical protein
LAPHAASFSVLFLLLNAVSPSLRSHRVSPDQLQVPVKLFLLSGGGGKNENSRVLCFHIESDSSYPKKLENEYILSDIYSYNTEITIFIAMEFSYERRIFISRSNIWDTLI